MNGESIARRRKPVEEPPGFQYLRATPTSRPEFESGTYGGYHRPKTVMVLCDAGPGFDPVRRTTAGETGRGFGLFSVGERLDLVGGRLEIDSAPGRGSGFILTAAIRAAGAGPENHAAPKARHAGIHG